MKKTIYDFENKYKTQDDLLNEGALEGLDYRTLHETIKAMLINTIKDCINYETWMDPDMAEISNLLVKEEKTEDDIRKIKNVQDRLRNSLHFVKISEDSLYTLLYQMLSSDVIKHAFKQDIPAIYENLYYMVDMESEIAESITFEFAELYEVPSYKVMCVTINSTIKNFIENAEEYIEDIKKHDLYDQFVSYREQSIKRKQETELENKLEGIKNYSIAVKEKGEDIIFLRKIVNGGTDESYGVHVARLAGVPKDVAKRANEILRSLERKNILNGKQIENKKQVEGQLDMENYKLAELAQEIDKIDLNVLTPIDALNTLVKIREKMS